jgi:hypothetical protein
MGFSLWIADWLMRNVNQRTKKSCKNVVVIRRRAQSMQPSSGMFVSEVQGLLMAMSDAKGRAGSGGGPSPERPLASSARPPSRGVTHHVPSLPVPAAMPDRLPSAEQRGKAPPPSYTRVRMSDIIMS